MRFSLASVFALVGAALAADPTAGFNAISKPTEGEKVPAGSTYEIVWSPTAQYPGAITITLIGGKDQGSQNTVDTIAKGIDPSTGSYSWDVPATLGDLAIYGIQITLDSDKTIFQWGFPFKIVGGSTSTSASASETAPSSSATGSSSASRTASSASTSAAPPSSTILSSTVRSNLSTTATGNPQTTITSLVTQQPSTTRTATTSIVTNGVASIAAGSFAMLGGVAMAVLAL